MKSMIAFAALFLFADTSIGEGTKVSKGDTVKFQWGGKWQKAKVLEVNRNGWLKLGLEVNGRQFSPVVPPKRVQTLDGKAVATDASPAKGKDQFKDAEFRYWRDSRNQLIVEGKIHKYMKGKGGKVLIYKKDGRCISKWVRELSKRDQEYVKGLADK